MKNKKILFYICITLLFTRCNNLFFSKISSISNDDKKVDLSFIDTIYVPKIIVFISKDCPICRYQLHNLNVIQDRYGDSIYIIGVLPNKDADFKQIKWLQNEYNMKYNLYIDNHKELTTKLHATTTPEVFLISSSNKVIYSGMIDDKFKKIGIESSKPENEYLIIAIESILRNKSILTKKTNPIGCYIY